jgi:hypothetical protein
MMGRCPNLRGNKVIVNIPYLFRRHKAPAGSRQGCRTYQNERYLKYILTHLNLRVIEVPAVSRVTNSYITYFAAVHGLHPSFIS